MPDEKLRRIAIADGSPAFRTAAANYVADLPGYVLAGTSDTALQALSLAIPHTYVINAARTVLMEDPGTFTMPFSTAVLALTVFNLVVFTSGLWLLHRSMQYARKMGMLSGY